MPRPSLAAMLALWAVPAIAQVAPEDVWDRYRTQLETAGYTVTAQETLRGDTLTLSDLTLEMDLPDEDGDVRIVVDGIAFEPDGDAVRIVLPDALPVRATFMLEDGMADATLTLDHTALSILASGTPDALVYDYDAETLSVTLQDLVVDGETLGPDDAAMRVALSDLTGRTRNAAGDGARRLSQEFDIGAADYAFAFTDPDTGETGAVEGRLTGVAAEGTSTIPEGTDLQDMAAALRAGFAGSGRVTHSGGALRVTVMSEDGPFDAASRTGGASLDVALDPDGLRYALGATDAALTMSGASVPVPVDLAMDEVSLSFTLPVVSGDDPQEAGLGLVLNGFTMTEFLWSMVDPGGVLPRDPATVALDLTAQVRLFQDLLDVEAMQDAAGEAPGTLESLTLDRLRVAAVGAELTGEGAFTFDNADLETFDGMPRPQGGVDLRVTGANALIDALIRMGVLTEEDAMGARMMLAMFTVPGTAPDSATARIEINAAGHILANGQRIQ